VSAVDRLNQGLLALRAQPEPDERAVVARWLTPAQCAAFMRVSAHDRAHLVRVARSLTMSGRAHPDLIVAGLLHDIGKVDGHHHVRLIDRTLKVLLSRCFPRLLARLASRERPLPLCGGLMLAVHHPEIGSERARALGCTERTCWLIKNHDNPAPEDPDLRRLIAVDRSTP
jgi:hypothetical protein